jgi:hypothetical protein
MSKLASFWHRLRAMDAREIARRAAAKARAFTGPDPDRVLAEFQLGPVNGAARRFLPERDAAPAPVRDAVAARAEAARCGRWLFFGWKEVTMPDPPAWDWDPVHDCRAPLDVPAGKLDHRRLPGGADPRCVWEANRWAELVSLAQNAWLNGALEDGRLAQRWLADWAERNPVGRGINWTSALEAGLRLMQFTWLDALLRAAGDGELAKEQESLARRIVPGHAWWVGRHLSPGSSANNHLLGELSGLVMAACRWPALMHLCCCPEQAWARLQAEVERQFAPDGGNREQALHYHLFAWEMAWQARRVMGAGSAGFERRLERAAAFFAALSQPREPWDYGDSDDAEITPLTLGRERAMEEWAAWLGGGSLDEAVALRFWLGDPPARAAASGVSVDGQWRVFEESGLAAAGAGDWFARVDASPLGFGSMAAHGHLDALHVSLWNSGRAVIVDPGTGAYYSDSDLRAELADWGSHNGPVPAAGRSAPRRIGTFLWTRHHESPVARVEEGALTVCLACDGPFLRRTVRLTREGLEVVDRICTELPHEVRWIFAPGWWLDGVDGKGGFRLVTEEGSALRIRMESGGTLEIERERRRVSPRFLSVEPADALRVRFTGELRTQVERDG